MVQTHVVQGSTVLIQALVMIFQPGFGEHFSGSFISDSMHMYTFMVFNSVLFPFSRRVLTLKNLTVY